MASVELRQLGKRFGDAMAVAPTDLSIGDGEFFVLVGPSGSGKSTLLAMIAGLTEASSGCILVDGIDVTGRDASRRDMAMVFQNYALYPHMCVFDNLAFPLRLAGSSSEEIGQRVHEVAAMLAIDELLARRPASLSGGQRQRVAMGRALVRRPKVFLLDEPLSNLDAQLRVQMRAEIARLHRRFAVTTLYVTHDQTEAMTLGERIAVLHEGQVQQVGTPRQLYEAPANLFVAGFIGEPAINVLPATVRGQRLLLPAGALPLPPQVGVEEGSTVMVGIRPEHLMVADKGVSGLAMQVERIEWLGAECHVHGMLAVPEGERVAEQGLTLRLVDAGAIREGEHVAMDVHPEHIHLFAPEDGRRIGM